MVELLQGTFSKAVMQRLCRLGDGLFPGPKEIEFTCSCPDWALMCKHVAAALYGVGARLDQRPELLFQLRRVDGNDLLAQAGTDLIRAGKRPPKARVLDESALGDVFGIEMAEVATPRDSVRAAAGRDKNEVARAVRAASKVVAEANARSSSASKADSNAKTTASAPLARAAVPARTPARMRRGVHKENPPQPIAANRKTQAVPTAVAVNHKPKRKPRT